MGNCVSIDFNPSQKSRNRTTSPNNPEQIIDSNKSKSKSKKDLPSRPPWKIQKPKPLFKNKQNDVFKIVVKIKSSCGEKLVGNWKEFSSKQNQSQHESQTVEQTPSSDSHTQQHSAQYSAQVSLPSTSSEILLIAFSSTSPTNNVVDQIGNHQGVAIENLQRYPPVMILQLWTNLNKYPNLRQLILENCQIKNKCFLKIRSIVSLIKINVAFNESITPQAFIGLPLNIKSLVLGFIHKNDEQINQILSKLTTIERFHYKSKLTSEMFSTLMNRTEELTKLTLSDQTILAQISDQNIKEFNKYQKLKKVVLSYREKQNNHIKRQPQMNKEQFLKRISLQRKRMQGFEPTSGNKNPTF